MPIENRHDSIDFDPFNPYGWRYRDSHTCGNNLKIYMKEDITRILRGWDYTPGELSVRQIDGHDGRQKIQVRMDLGLMQLEWAGRPDAYRPHGCESLLDYFQDERRRWEDANPHTPFTLSRDDCWDLSQEAMKYYWRRISFFELKEYERAEQDALHNLAILELCFVCAEDEEDRQMAEQHTPFVTAHRFQARALRRFDRDDFDGTLKEIRAGIEEIEGFFSQLGHLDQIEGCPELRFLRDWEEEVENSRPLTLQEQLRADLKAAVEQEQFELAASLRDRLRRLGSGPSLRSASGEID